MARNRNVQIIFWVSEKEKSMIEEKMAQAGMTNLSAYLRRLYDVKQRFGDSDYFWAKADDAHQIAILERGGDKGRFLGVFSLRALAADVAVDAPDGCYVNLIDDENVEIRGGKLFCDGRPIILAL